MTPISNERAEGAFRRFVTDVADAVDQADTRPSKLAPDELFDLEGCYALDDQHRIARRFARKSHMREAIAYCSSLECRRRMKQEYERLAPYWQEDMTKAEAVAAYLAANPIDQSERRRRMSETNGDAQGGRTPGTFLRLPKALDARLDRAAKALGLTKVSLIRLTLSEQVHVYEERAETSRPKEVRS